MRIYVEECVIGIQSYFVSCGVVFIKSPRCGYSDLGTVPGMDIGVFQYGVLEPNSALKHEK